MTRSEHIINIINEICQEAGFTILDKYEETDQVAVDKTAYTFIFEEGEEAFFEDSRTFEMTSTLLTYIDFKIDDFNDSFTTKKNEIIQDFENARVTADLTLDRTETYFIYSSTVPKIVSISGTMDTNNRKGIVDIVFQIKTLSRPV
jgi:hypothetical protein